MDIAHAENRRKKYVQWLRVIFKMKRANYNPRGEGSVKTPIPFCIGHINDAEAKCEPLPCCQFALGQLKRHGRKPIDRKKQEHKNARYTPEKCHRLQGQLPTRKAAL